MAIEVARTRAAPAAAPARSSDAEASGRSLAQVLATPIGAKSSGKLTVRDRMFFTERLELLLETGTTLHVALQSLGQQARGTELGEVIDDLCERVTGGQSFSQALAQWPDAFPSTYVNLVSAGEQGGFLPSVLERLRELDEKREELRGTLTSAFTYPAFLVGFSIFVVVFVLVVVFPKFEEIFVMIRDQLPFTTRFLMDLSDVLRRRWAPLLAGLVGAIWLGRRWLSSPSGAQAVDRITMKIPLLREIVVQFHLVQFLHVMSLSLRHEVPMLDALRACRDVVSGASFRRFVTDLETRVSEGQGVASGFGEAPFLPPLVTQMVSTGEESGSLALVMGRIADFYEREWRRRLLTLAKVVEPTMLLVMGVVVGIIVSSLLLPIFKLSQTVH